MKIGVLGSGVVGKALAEGFIKSGNEAMIGSRTPDKLNEWVNKTGKGASSGTFEESAKYGEMIIFCPLFRAAEVVIKQAGTENLKGKIIIDTTNPIAETPPNQGVLTYTTGNRESAGELVQKWLPDSLVVKAFNSIGRQFMFNPHFE